MKLVATLIVINFLTMNAQTNKWLDIQLSNYDYAYPSHFITVKNQGQELEMSYMYIKPDNYNGENVMLLHGKNFNGAYWRSTIELLTNEGYACIVPDQIGFGKSSKPTNYQYTFQQLAQNTLSILDELGIEKTSVLGHSMGGMLATRFTLMFPDRVEKLVLANPIGLEDWKLVVPYKSVDFWYDYELKATPQSLMEYQKESYYGGNWNPKYQEWVDLYAGWLSNSEYPLIAWNSALTYDMIFTQPVLYEFPNIRNKTLLIIGTRDRTALGKPLVSPAVRETMGRYDILGKKTQALIPGSQLAEIPNVGALPHIEAFDQFNGPLINFLKSK